MEVGFSASMFTLDTFSALPLMKSPLQVVFLPPPDDAERDLGF
jgi:hypothetical protein